jgi:twitching motility protein PilJ
MAKSSDTSSLFRTVSMTAALSLIVAGALFFFQAGSGSSGAELAALSQSLPDRASAALNGSGGGFAVFDASVKKIRELRRAANPATPGNSSDWRELDARAAAILAKRIDVEALFIASSSIARSTTAMLELSNELLDRSSATAVIQQFQQRTDQIAKQAEGLATNADAVNMAAGIGDDAVFLREVINALGGEESELDVRQLDDAGREAALVPLLTHMADLEGQVSNIKISVLALAGLDEELRALTDASRKLMDTAFTDLASTNLLPSYLNILWIPIGLVGFAALLVMILVRLNRRSSAFEQTAMELGAQNEKNQQAILRLLDEMGSLADGDLTVEASVTEDITGTIADSFNYAIEELRKLVTTVNETAIMVDSAAKQTESTAAHMAKAAENQTREINAATESIVSMAASIEEVSGNAERSSDVARHSVEVAHKGGEAVQRTIDGMNTIRETIQDTSKRIKRLGESSQEIGNIVELINDIAEQTNILALNASIQASMAGEAGRGFAVVADEVQRLAERSTNATRQIEVLVSTIQADTKEAVVSMERSTTDVVGGALLAENAGAALDEIEQVSNQIASLVQNISNSARQQAGSAADLTRRTTRLSEISAQTSKATAATAAAISKLSEFASQLRMTVAGFTLPKESMPATLQSTTVDARGTKNQRQMRAG